jgi:hypothetical protein
MAKIMLSYFYTGFGTYGLCNLPCDALQASGQREEVPRLRRRVGIDCGEETRGNHIEQHEFDTPRYRVDTIFTIISPGIYFGFIWN